MDQIIQSSKPNWLVYILTAVAALTLGTIIGFSTYKSYLVYVASVTPIIQGYTCPENGWVDCMPILDEAKQKACSSEAMEWYKANCPNFQGVAQ